jgi:hypothetical protein
MPDGPAYCVGMPDGPSGKGDTENGVAGGQGRGRAPPCLLLLTPAALAARDSAGAFFFPGGSGPLMGIHGYAAGVSTTLPCRSCRFGHGRRARDRRSDDPPR